MAEVLIGQYEGSSSRWGSCVQWSRPDLLLSGHASVTGSPAVKLAPLRLYLQYMYTPSPVLTSTRNPESSPLGLRREATGGGRRRGKTRCAHKEREVPAGPRPRRGHVRACHGQTQLPGILVDRAVNLQEVPSERLSRHGRPSGTSGRCSWTHKCCTFVR